MSGEKKGRGRTLFYLCFNLSASVENLFHGLKRALCQLHISDNLKTRESLTLAFRRNQTGNQANSILVDKNLVPEECKVS